MCVFFSPTKPQLPQLPLNPILWWLVNNLFKTKLSFNLNLNIIILRTS